MTLKERIFLAQKYFEDHMEKKISLQRVSKASFLSPFHFHRTFQGFTGLSPRAYFEKIKLERGAYLLRFTKQSIGDIAFMLGFENPESFARSFKVFFNQSPTQFRKEKSPFGSDHGYNTDDLIEKIKIVKVNKPKLVSFQNLEYFYYRYTGPWAGSGRIWRKIMDWGLQYRVFHKESKLVGIWYDDPLISSIRHQRFDLGILVSQLEKSLLSFPPTLHKAKIDGDYLQFSFRGPFSQLESFYPAIYKSLFENTKIAISNKPVIELYRKFPPFYQPSDFETEVCIPIL